MGIEGITVGKMVHYVGGNGFCSAALVVYLWKSISDVNNVTLRLFRIDPEDDESVHTHYSADKELFTFHFIEGCK